jgi:copper chaperone CopZ
MNKIFTASLLYLKNVTSKFDLHNRNNNNKKMIYHAARVGGYNIGRGISATGTIALQLKPGIAILDEVPSGEITIYNGRQISNKSNNLQYFIDLGTERVSYALEHNKLYYLPIVQGRRETHTFTGTGNKLQSLQVSLPNGQEVEHFRVSVRVNGEVWSTKTHLYDILPEEKACVVMTGFEGGIDVYFGTGFHGMIPSIGSEIAVSYIITDGSLGNIPHRLENDWTFIDEIYDGFGGSVDVEQYFNVFIHNEVSMGSDGETPEFTKAILPYASRNFVLVRPEQYLFLLKRLNIFSQIDVYTTEKGSSNDDGNAMDDSVVYMFLIPDINLFLTGGNSYFDLDMNAFYLDDHEKTKIERYLKTEGTVGLGNAVKIIEPVIRKYIVNIHLRLFVDAIEDNVRSEVLNRLSVYFGTMSRRGRIPQSDINKVIEEIDGVDSVKVEFISEANEQYHLDFEMYKESVSKANPKLALDKITKADYSADKVIGLDPVLGDIVYEKNELPIIRGGFKTRNGVFYNETPQTKGLSSVNIMINKELSKRKPF